MSSSLFAGGITRMASFLLLTVLLMVACLVVQQHWPGTLVAVTLYKAHLLALAGWGGYWLDRALFPYDRPHAALQPIPAELQGGIPVVDDEDLDLITASDYSLSMLRRALVVLGALLCVGLGA